MSGLAGSSLAIVGLGQMGGSLAGTLRGQCRAVVGVAHREGIIAAALARGLVDRGSTDLAAGVRQAGVLTNHEAVLETLRDCGRQLGRLAGLIERGDEGGLRSALDAVRERRGEFR